MVQKNISLVYYTLLL